jgi:two-component system, chemotaxis family, sensor kinase Cph1
MQRAPGESTGMSLVNTLFVNPPSRPAWDLGAFRVLAERRSAGDSSGGDFYAFRLRGPKRLAVVIGDACGRGQEAANLLPGVLQRLHETAASAVRPSALLHYLNRGLAAELSSDRFVTGAALEIDGQAGTITVANAGHVPAVLRHASGKVEIVGRASGPPLGILSDAHYRDETYRIESGDVLVLMTDGVLEAVETDLAEMPTLSALVGQCSGSGGAVHGRLLAQLAGQLSQRAPDDMTLLSLELLAEARKATLCGLPAMA